nr:Arm DNA-binding domain-containing protein [Commensalibacter melissae]
MTDSRVNSARKKDKPYRLNDGNGLYLNVSRSGTKSWRVRYKFNSKESMIVIGHYPSMSLADARSAALDVRNGIREGRNPNTDKLLKKNLAISNYENTLEVVARKWWDTKKLFGQKNMQQM